MVQVAKKNNGYWHLPQGLVPLWLFVHRYIGSLLFSIYDQQWEPWIVLFNLPRCCFYDCFLRVNNGWTIPWPNTEFTMLYIDYNFHIHTWQYSLSRFIFEMDTNFWKSFNRVIWRSWNRICRFVIKICFQKKRREETCSIWRTWFFKKLKSVYETVYLLAAK